MNFDELTQAVGKPEEEHVLEILNSFISTNTSKEEAGLRDNLKINVGGNPITKEACEHIGSDAFTTNASESIKIAQGWVK
ncbi:MAG: hypothetical protein ACOWWH_04245 [Eubacteriaceae bacterium]